MKLGQKAKKAIIISLCSILALVLLVWYFLPVLMANLFLYRDDTLSHDLRATPIVVTSLERPPSEWQPIIIGMLGMKLPTSEYKKIIGHETLIYFFSEKYSLTVYDIVPSKTIIKLIKENKLKYPSVSYKDMLEIYCSTPEDISIFNSRSKNTISSQNQILKAMSMPAGGLKKILLVNTVSLKALCVLSKKGDNGYSASVHVYSQNERTSLSLSLHRYNDDEKLEADLYAILAGMNMPDHMDDLDSVDRDIRKLVQQFKENA